MLCAKCGTENEETSSFCSNCGASLLQSGESNSADNHSFKTPGTAKTPWYYQSWLIVLLLFTISPAGILLMWLQQPKGSFLGKTVSRVILTLLFGLAWLGVVFGNSDKTRMDSSETNHAIGKTSLKDADVMQQAKDRKGGKEISKGHDEPSVPLQQSELSRVVNEYVNKYRKADNELKKSTLRTERRKAIKNALNESCEIVDWVGTLKDMGTTSERNAYVSIQPDECSFRVQTWNNELSDISGNTLIPQGTELYQELAELNKGNRVLFSGHFVPGEDDFVQEQSLTEQGSMTDPEFTVIFTSIKKK